jgi:hypothetical protein
MSSEGGISPKPHNWFPPQYLGTPGDTAAKIRNRRGQLYLSTKSTFRLDRDESGLPAGLEQKVTEDKICAEEVEGGNGILRCVSKPRFHFVKSVLVIQKKTKEEKWKRVLPEWELEVYLERIHLQVGPSFLH